MKLLLYVILDLHFQLLSAFLNHYEVNLSLDVVKSLKIRHCFFVQNENNEDLIFYFKKFSSANIPVAYLSYDSLPEYVTRTRKHMSTGFIFKEKNLNRLRDIVKEADRTYKMGNFIWLALIENTMENIQNHDLSVPYNCQFIVIQQPNGLAYKLTEIYEVKNKSFSIDFGKWDQEGLKTSTLSFYRRRQNFKKTEIQVLIDRHAGVDKSYEYITQTIFGLVDMMNLTYYGVQLTNIDTHLEERIIDIFHFTVPFNYYQAIDTMGPILKMTINWYIGKYRKVGMRSDYYLRPFDTYVWLALLSLITIATFLIIITRYRIQNKNSTLIDNLFFGLETFCNQCGNDDIENASSGSICIFLRLTSLILIGLYGAIITSFFAAESFQPPFKNLDQFLKNGEYLFIERKYRAEHFRGLLMNLSNSNMSKIIYENFTKFIDVNTLSELFEKICYEKYVVYFFDDYATDFDYPCAIYKIPTPLNSELRALWMKRNSTFTKIFNKNVIRLRETGTSLRFKTAADYTSEKSTSKNSDSSFRPFEFQQMTQVVLIPFTGILLGVIIILIESIKKYLT